MLTPEFHLQNVSAVEAIKHGFRSSTPTLSIIFIIFQEVTRFYLYFNTIHILPKNVSVCQL